MAEETTEIWKTIPEFPNYQVSNKGNVKSLNYLRTGKEKILKPFKNKDGYLQVYLHKNGKRKFMLVHRLVAITFIPNTNNFPQVNHRNEIKEDNRVENLEFCDARYNVNYGTRNERDSKTQTNHPKKSKQVKCLETGIIYPSIMEIERRLGFEHQSISDCCNGKRNICGGYHWEFV